MGFRHRGSPPGGLQDHCSSQAVPLGGEPPVHGLVLPERQRQPPPRGPGGGGAAPRGSASPLGL
eukprot:449064-Alexandrium_andersonii.AAC.1